ncbi:putative membrane protein [Symbiobacterium terraclitae]|uniref:Membrane protein n=1 Tax=Symbiobacterium terraclitae TaxID=557451 RepID=A0ABS4JTA2_9FIRM|nr:putative membrane protein [Symbiobacterium terraclitae]
MEALLAVLPTVNAILISVSGVLILLGIRAIRRGEQDRHRRAMLTATGLAALFFVLYLTRVALGGLTSFNGPAALRPVYLAVLFSHLTLAIVQVPLVLVTLYQGLRGLFPRHRRLGRVTWPIWVYVSATGVLVYGLLRFPYAS